MITLIETPIVCRVYQPMAGHVMYGENEMGIPEATEPEVMAEMGWFYTVCSPLSPYAIGWKLWEVLCDIAGDLSLSDVFTTEVDFKKNTVTIFQKE